MVMRCTYIIFQGFTLELSFLLTYPSAIDKNEKIIKNINFEILIFFLFILDILNKQ